MPDPTVKGYVMTDEHKAAMSRARLEQNAVKMYLNLLQEDLRDLPKSIKRKGRSAAELAEALKNSVDPMERLTLRPLLRAALEAEKPDPRKEKILHDFITYAAAYSERMGLTYADWREEGVPAAVLKDAGIKRS